MASGHNCRLTTTANEFFNIASIFFSRSSAALVAKDSRIGSLFAGFFVFRLGCLIFAKLGHTRRAHAVLADC